MRNSGLGRWLLATIVVAGSILASCHEVVVAPQTGAATLIKFFEINGTSGSNSFFWDLDTTGDFVRYNSCSSGHYDGVAHVFVNGIDQGEISVGCTAPGNITTDNTTANKYNGTLFTVSTSGGNKTLDSTNDEILNAGCANDSTWNWTIRAAGVSANYTTAQITTDAGAFKFAKLGDHKCKPGT